MNAIAAPLVVALVVVMGLCVPKRLFSRRRSCSCRSAMVAVGVGVGLFTASLQTGLAVYLALAALIQVAVVAADRRGRARAELPHRGPAHQDRQRPAAPGLHRLRDRRRRAAALQPDAAGLLRQRAVLVTGGTALAFYADRLAWRPLRRSTRRTRTSGCEYALAGSVGGPTRWASRARLARYASRIMSTTRSARQLDDLRRRRCRRVGLPVPVDRQPVAVERHDAHRLEPARERRRRVGGKPLVDARLDEDLVLARDALGQPDEPAVRAVAARHALAR